MLQNAKFFLIDKAVIPNTGHNFNHLQLTSPCHQCDITPTTTDEGNTKACKNLEVRLNQKLSRTKWNLAVQFNCSWNPTPHPGTIDIGKVVVSGEILKAIHSLMLYNTQTARLKLRLSADLTIDLSVHTFCPNNKNGIKHKAGTTLATVNYKTELDQDSYNLSKYSSVGEGPTTSILLANDLSADQRDTKIQISNLNVWIEGIEFDLNSVKHSNAVAGQKMLLETGFCSDLKILTQDNEAIPSHKIVLSAQSSVLQTMLKDDSQFSEAKSGEIIMKDRSKDDVMAFLTFLYSGDLVKTLEDTALGVTLFEMGHYYDVKELEKALKPVFLSRPPNSFDVDAALRMFSVACGLEDPDLKQKAADVLEIRTNQEIFTCAVFRQLSAPVIGELFAMSRLKY